MGCAVVMWSIGAGAWNLGPVSQARHRRGFWREHPHVSGECHSLFGVAALSDSKASASFYKCEHFNWAAAAMVTGYISELGDRPEIR